MTNPPIENIIIVHAKTRLQQLLHRFNTLSNAQFYLEKSGQGNALKNLIREDEAIQNSIKTIRQKTSELARIKLVEKSFLSNFIFSQKDLVLCVGQDGLVANTAKYAIDIPIVGINPSPEIYDGKLLPFNVSDFFPVVRHLINGNSCDLKKVTMGEVLLNDGQKLLAFNDFFVGPKMHSSARYTIHFRGKTEVQSSSGIIISTGAGSTGWMSSIFNMATGVGQIFGQKKIGIPGSEMPWDTDRLRFAVREPFLSKTSFIDILAGEIDSRQPLIIESMMPENGVIFSDGIQEDFIEFTSGKQAKITLAAAKAKIVIN